MNRSLEALQSDSTEFQKLILKIRTVVLSPITVDPLQSTRVKDGEPSIPSDRARKDCERLNSTITKTVADLKQSWHEWEQVQQELVELGVEVFGVEAFKDCNKPDMEYVTGFKRIMEMLDQEHQARHEDMEEEIDLLSCDAIQKMTDSEKASDYSQGSKLMITNTAYI
jgi:hypothetical protein